MRHKANAQVDYVDYVETLLELVIRLIHLVFKATTRRQALIDRNISFVGHGETDKHMKHSTCRLHYCGCKQSKNYWTIHFFHSAILAKCYWSLFINAAVMMGLDPLRKSPAIIIGIVF